MAVNKEHLREALFFRQVEQALLSLFSQVKLHGTVHTCVGQEYSAVAFAGQAKKGSTLFRLNFSFFKMRKRFPRVCFDSSVERIRCYTLAESSRLEMAEAELRSSAERSRNRKLKDACDTKD